MFAGAGQIGQAGFMVDDFDAALPYWLKKGAGPFRVFRKVEVAAEYRGKPSTCTLTVALGQLDGLQIELIQQHGDGPSMFRECYPNGWPSGEGGFHHVGMANADFDLSLKKCIDQGFPILMSGRFKDWRFAHVDTRAQFGFVSELTEATGLMTTYFKEIADLAKNWDGRDPVRDGWPAGWD